MYLKSYKTQFELVVAFVLFPVVTACMLVLNLPPAHASPICIPGCSIRGCTSPLLIDTRGHTFELTSAKDGVVFDIHGDGHPILISWTVPNSGVGFLALDRNHNGTIDDGKELFGNFTSQDPNTSPNGFAALREFDKAPLGGNGDGIVDRRDAVFGDLLIWIDKNHDGQSQPDELHQLETFGIISIGLDVVKTNRIDKYGNAFRYRSTLTFDQHRSNAEMSKFIYDVYFTVPDPPAQ